LCEATGIPAAKLDAILESMANKGLVMDLPYAGTSYYLLMPGLIGFMEFTFMRHRGDLPLERLARLMSEYLHEQGREGQAGELFGSRYPIARALVYDEHIPVSSRIMPYEDARRIVRDSDYRAVTLCYCRHKKAHMGRACRKGAPVEGICMVLGEGARFLVRRGFAEARTVEQMLQTLEYARSLGLTHVTDNVREQPSFLCNCCRCCGVDCRSASGRSARKTNFGAPKRFSLCFQAPEIVFGCHQVDRGLEARHLKRHCQPFAGISEPLAALLRKGEVKPRCLLARAHCPAGGNPAQITASHGPCIEPCAGNR
jgi:hypothetical protein